MNRKLATGRLHLLTAREVQAAPDGNHSDGGGLTLRVHGVSVAWVFRYTAPSGSRREMGLGAVLRGSTKQAGDSLTAGRDLAHGARELLRRGTDPITERDEHRLSLRNAEQQRKATKAQEETTLARAARGYHERVIEPTRTPIHAAQWIASLENHLPASLWHAPIAAITPPQILQALAAARPHERARRQGDLGETLRRIRQRLDSVFEDAIFHGRCSTNPAAAIKRKMAEARLTPEKGQLAALDYRHAPALLTRVRAMPGTAARCLEFACLTASRTSEALLAEWVEFDLEAGVWIVPANRMKGREEHHVHLSGRVIEILKAQMGQDEVLVFPTTQPGRKGNPMSNMSMLVVLDRLDVRDLTTVHGLCRATFSTWANETGAARPDVIEACLAHREADRSRGAYVGADSNLSHRADRILSQGWKPTLRWSAVDKCRS